MDRTFSHHHRSYIQLFTYHSTIIHWFISLLFINSLPIAGLLCMAMSWWPEATHVSMASLSASTEISASRHHPPWGSSWLLPTVLKREDMAHGLEALFWPLWGPSNKCKITTKLFWEEFLKYFPCQVGEQTRVWRGRQIPSGQKVSISYQTLNIRSISVFVKLFSTRCKHIRNININCMKCNMSQLCNKTVLWPYSPVSEHAAALQCCKLS